MQQRADATGGRIALVCPQPRIIRLLEITGLTERFEIHDTAESAVGAGATPSEVVFELEQTLDEPARARAFVAVHLAGYSRDSRDDAILLVSELVTNVVRHGALPARMVMQLAGPQLHVVVQDSGVAIPEGPRTPSAVKPDGRGLIIVAAIAAAWGISTTAGQAGKSVWFDLAVVP